MSFVHVQRIGIHDLYHNAVTGEHMLYCKSSLDSGNVAVNRAAFEEFLKMPFPARMLGLENVHGHTLRLAPAAVKNSWRPGPRGEYQIIDMAAAKAPAQADQWDADQKEVLQGYIDERSTTITVSRLLANLQAGEEVQIRRGKLRLVSCA